MKPTVAEIVRDEYQWVRQNVKMSVEVITPNKAKKWLEMIINIQRSPREKIIAKYATDMSMGNWHFDGCPIVFDLENQLINGQNRLLASVKSQEPFVSIVMQGVKTQAILSMDETNTRTFGDVLKIRGHARYCIAASITLALFEYEHAGARGQLAQTPSYDMLYKLYQENADDIQEAAEFAGSHYPAYKVFLSPKPVGLMRLLSRRIDSGKSDDFLEKVIYGTNCPMKHPCWVLRNDLTNRAARPQTIVPNVMKMALLIKAWNLYFVGKQNVGAMRWMGTEDMPTMIGAS